MSYNKNCNQNEVSKDVNIKDFTFFYNPYIWIAYIVILVVTKSITVLLILILFSIIPLSITIMSFIDNNKKKRMEKRNNKRTKIINTIIYNIKYDYDELNDYIWIISEYKDLDKKYYFKSNKIINKRNRDIGDNIYISVDPNNYKNYEFIFDD